MPGVAWREESGTELTLVCYYTLTMTNLGRWFLFA